VHGVVRVQTANPLGWRAWHRAGYERLNAASGRLLTLT